MIVVVTRRASATHEGATGHNIRAVQDVPDLTHAPEVDCMWRSYR
jgi:hypothetical protein